MYLDHLDLLDLAVFQALQVVMESTDFRVIQGPEVVKDLLVAPAALVYLDQKVRLVIKEKREMVDYPVCS